MREGATLDTSVTAYQNLGPRVAEIRHELLEEAATVPQVLRQSRRASGGVWATFGQGRSRLAAAALAGAALACGSAGAQESAVVIDKRIQGVFTDLPGNAVDLAIPLTRRALKRRSVEEGGQALPYLDARTEPPLAADDQAQARGRSRKAAVAAAPEAAEEPEEGSAEDPKSARFPRPRPGAKKPQEPETAAAPVQVVRPVAAQPSPQSNAPPDLVAGAALPERSEREVPPVPRARPAVAETADIVTAALPPALTPRPTSEPAPSRPPAPTSSLPTPESQLAVVRKAAPDKPAGSDPAAIIEAAMNSRLRPASVPPAVEASKSPLNEKASSHSQATPAQRAELDPVARIEAAVVSPVLHPRPPAFTVAASEPAQASPGSAEPQAEMPDAPNAAAAAPFAAPEPVPDQQLQTTASDEPTAPLPRPDPRMKADASKRVQVAAASLGPEKSGAAARAKRPLPKNCLAVAKVEDKDDDFKRNLEALSRPGLCIAVEKFNERRRPWTVQAVISDRPGPVWAVMHDDEDLSFDTAVHALDTYGGTLITVDTGGGRNQDGVDPNRTFSDDELSCSNLGKSAAPKFTAAMRRHFDTDQPVIALHSNVDGPVPTGGLGHVSMSAPPKGMKVTRSKRSGSELADDHTLVLLAALDPADASVKDRVAKLSAAGIHVIVEHVRKERSDCSLSNYAVLTGHAQYFNVTVDHDGGDKQRGIIDAIMATSSTVVVAR